MGSSYGVGRKNSLRPPIDKKKLREYVLHRTKNDIAVEVHLKFPFNEELKGWRIIDTPSIGAIEGIEDRTKQLLGLTQEDGSREFDAIIFLQDGSQTLDQTDAKKFVKEQFDNFSESDKRRLFFVLTHSADTNFLNDKENKLDTIQKNYGDKIKYLTYVDSLLYAFINDLIDCDVDLKNFELFEVPKGWSNAEWNNIMAILFQAKRHLYNSGDTINNETIFRTIDDWANFTKLKKEINLFAKVEKSQTLTEIFKLVGTDYLGFIRQLGKEKELVDGSFARIICEIDDENEKRTDYNSQSKEIEKNSS